MKFKKEDLKALVYEDFDSEVWEVIENNIVDTSRWSTIYEMVFKYQDKFYQTGFSRGATESQDESPYEYDGDEIECKEVVQVEKVVKVWTIKE
jgi:hypothetical protein